MKIDFGRVKKFYSMGGLSVNILYRNYVEIIVCIGNKGFWIMREVLLFLKVRFGKYYILLIY